ncbi:MAG TPA: hypothetical protein PK406_15775 [Verrucomicrobiota bacterium]|nr:hypothetical protein [Verrucomicrobiota bacterium]
MLSPHLIKGRNAQQVVVIRHPADQAPSGVRHEVVAVIGTLPPQPRVSQKPDIARLLAEAAAWITAAPPETELEPLAEFGVTHRRQRMEAGYAEARRERATLVRALRNGVPREELAKTYGAKRVADVVMADHRLSAVPAHAPPPAERLRRALETACADADRRVGQPDDDPRYWAGRAALARELLALWAGGQAPADPP